MKSELKKILIITYYWPPAGGPGVQRWLKFVKYLPDFNINPVVFLPENPSYPILDEDILKEIPENVTIIRKKIFEPYKFASFFSKKNTKKISSGIIPNYKKQTAVEKLLLWIRGNIFIPDARVFWVKPSVAFLQKYIQQNNIDTIITTGPPHSLHLIGMQLKTQLQIKWIADFRDPWTTIGYHKALKLTSKSQAKHKKLEQAVLNTANVILVTSPTTKEEFQALTSTPIAVITNGYDEIPNAIKCLDKKFSLAHIGSLLSERNPILLWEIIAELLVAIPTFSSHFELKLIGNISQEVLDTIHKFNLDSYLNNKGYVSHNEAIYQMQKSQVLLLIEINSEETKSILPGKLFEYLVSERPIFAIGPKGSDIAAIITETNSGSFFNYEEKEAMKNVILSYYELYLEGKLKSNAVGLLHYSRKKLTEKLAAIINEK